MELGLAVRSDSKQSFVQPDKQRISKVFLIILLNYLPTYVPIGVLVSYSCYT